MHALAHETNTHDRTLVSAISAAIDRVEHHLGVGDALMADVAGAVVCKLITHPYAGFFSSDIEWRRMLVRWQAVRARIGTPPLMLADLIDHHASVLLIEATRAARSAAL